jgi:hypothetical protein
MTTITFRPMPSPNNTNFERLYVARIPRGSEKKVELALDSAMRSKHGGDEQERDLAELRRKLEHVLSQSLSDEAYSAALDALNEHLPEGGRTYGDEETEREWYQHEDEPREPREPDGEDEEGEIPRNAREGGMGGATKTYGDRHADDRRRRRGARDSRLVAMDAQDSFEAMFPGVSRIKPATSFR